MKKLYIFLVFLFMELIASAQPSMTILNHWQLTPDASNGDTSGVFCRTFYHPSRNKFYVVYAGRQANVNGMQYFRWEEFDRSFTPTGNEGTLSGFSSSGDFAMVMVGNYYYHITADNGWTFRLSKYDDNFNFIDSVNIPLDSSDSQADMMMNYTNGKLVIGAFHVTGTFHPSMPQQLITWMPNMHKWEYDLNLNSLAAPVYLNETFTTWGASVIYNSNMYNVVTEDKFPNFHLHVYQYDNNWNFVDSLLLNTDGQWSQGVLWDGTYYYVSYHAGHEHRSGNVVVAMYDVNWNLVYDTTITNNAVFDPQSFSPPLNTTEHNANRPFLTKVNDTLIVSYDEDDYQLSNYMAHMYHEGNRWMANVTELKVNGITGINDDHVESVRIFPSPATDLIQWSDPDEQFDRVMITDLQGRIICNSGIEDGVNSVNVLSLPSGIYFVQLYSRDGILFTSKMVKE